MINFFYWIRPIPIYLKRPAKAELIWSLNSISYVMRSLRQQERHPSVYSNITFDISLLRLTLISITYYQPTSISIALINSFHLPHTKSISNDYRGKYYLPNYQHMLGTQPLYMAEHWALDLACLGFKLNSTTYYLNKLTSLTLSFFICQMRIIIIPSHRIVKTITLEIHH